MSETSLTDSRKTVILLIHSTEVFMTQITINQWLANNTTQGVPMPRYQIVNSKKFFGHYDILDTHTGQRTPQGTTSVRWIQYEVNALNSKSIIK